MSGKKMLSISLILGFIATIIIGVMAIYTDNLVPGIYGDKIYDPLHYGFIFIINSLFIFLFLVMFNSLKSEKGREVQKQSGISMAIRILIIAFVWFCLVILSGTYGQFTGTRMTLLHLVVFLLSLVFSSVKIWRWKR